MENKQVNDTKTSDVRFSIVIPTRERAETLKYAIQTCLCQQFDSYEIVIQDNCSSPATKEVVDSFKSKKIKYFRSEIPLAMSENWELALSHAVGEYIIFIGDDDGLLLNSLPKIDHLIRKLNAKALCWTPVDYVWPDTPLLSVDMIKVPWKRGIKFLRAIDVIPKAANNQLTKHERLPMMYHSAIHRDLIALLHKKTGRVFGACSPDIYTGFAFAYLLKVYPVSECPMSIGGTSAKSNGVQQSLLQQYNKESEIVQEFNTLNAKSGLKLHPKIPNLPLPLFLAYPDAFLHAKDALFPNDTNFCLDRKSMIMGCILRLRPKSKEKWKEYMKAIRESLSDDPDLQKWFDSKFSNYSPFSRGKLWVWFDSKFPRRYLFTRIGRKLIRWRHYVRGNYIVDAREFSVKNVFGVAELYDKTNGFKLSKLSLKYICLRLGDALLNQ